MDPEKFIFCLEAVSDVGSSAHSDAYVGLEKLAFEFGIDSIYETCDTIEGLQDSLNILLYEDHNFTNYEIIYLVMEGQGNNICINDYYYSIEELAELFEGRMSRKIVHFANVKTLDLSREEAQYFLDVTGARAISGYGTAFDTITSSKLDSVFFSLCQDQDDVVDIVEDLHERHYNICRMLDFRLYYNEQ